MTRQLALPFRHQPHYAAVDFLAADSNQAARAWLATTEWPAGRLALWGEPGVGKTHLLHIWAARAGATLLSAATLRGLPAWPRAPIALDDADACADEPALLHLLNAAAEAHAPLLLTARRPPARWCADLADLRSRLRAITAVEITPPEDSLLEALLARLIADRQLAVPPDLQAYFRDRLPRTPAALREAVCRLDRAMLAAGKLTRALLADIADEMADTEGKEAVLTRKQEGKWKEAVLF